MCWDLKPVATIEILDAYDRLEADFNEVNEGLHEVRELVNAQSENVVHDIRSIMEERDFYKNWAQKFKRFAYREEKIEFEFAKREEGYL